MYLFTLQKLPGTNWNIRLLILYNYGNIFTRTCNSKLLCRRQTRIHHFSESDAKPSLIQLIKDQLINSFLKRLSLISFIFLGKVTSLRALMSVYWSVCWSVRSSIGLSRVCPIFLNEGKVTLPCSYRNTCFFSKCSLQSNVVCNIVLLLEVKLPYDPSCPSVVCWSVSRSVRCSVCLSVCHNFKLQFPCSYRSTCFFLLYLSLMLSILL